MFKSKGMIDKAAPLVLTLLLALPLSNANAAKECKGLSKKQCGSNDHCSWVASYKTKSGKTVDSYCRNKPKKSSKSDTSKNKTKG
jgi:hypothetical protein